MEWGKEEGKFVTLSVLEVFLPHINSLFHYSQVETLEEKCRFSYYGQLEGDDINLGGLLCLYVLQGDYIE